MSAGIERPGQNGSERASKKASQVNALRRPKAPWTQARGLDAVVSEWDKRGDLRSMVLDHTLPPKDGVFASFPSQVAEPIKEALEKRGMSQMYSHQAQAIELALAGKDVVVATPTASGKSLCYHVPVLNAFCQDQEARAIYLFPTKALSRDQEVGLRDLMRDVGLTHGAITYDGDTPGDARRVAKERSGVLITNPDMLHAGVLPHHAGWSRLFSNLKYVVIDELHTYRGVFGSHLANVLRRLMRIAKFHGSDPQFLFSSATIGNPQEHAGNMIGRTPELVNESGAPEGGRRVMVYNPPFVNQELGIRRSYLKSAVRITSDLIRSKVPTLLFGQSRNNVEVMLKYLRDRLSAQDIAPEQIQGYRGGYLPDARRRIEGGLKDGSVRCVVATNALELGIDIGSLDAVVCAGYPGSVASLWQRFGRGGRTKGQSLAVLVTSSLPLDQFLASDPEYIIGAPIEHARIDPNNVEILIQHLKCGAFELPFAEGDNFGNLPAETLLDALGFLTDHKVLHPTPGPGGTTTYHWATDAYPANSVSLRSASWDNFVVIDLDRDKTIAEMDWRSTHTMLHEQAIYQHDGEQYQVEKLDYENHKAYVRLVKPDYYTTAMTHTRVEVLEQDKEAVSDGPGAFRLQYGFGEVTVVEKVVGYKKIKYHTHENVGYGDVHLPEMQMHTTGFWVTFPERLIESAFHNVSGGSASGGGAGKTVSRPVVIDALRGLSKAMHTVGAMGLMIDPRDLGRTMGDKKEEDGPPKKVVGGGPGFDPTVFLFDRVAGGIGLAPRLFEDRETVLRRARELIAQCECAVGCPACVGPQIGAQGEPLPGGDSAESPPSLVVSKRVLLLDLLSAVGFGATH